MSVHEVVPKDNYTVISPETFERKSAHRFDNVGTKEILVSLGCAGCAGRVCLEVNADTHARELQHKMTETLGGLGVPAAVVSHSRTLKVAGDCTQPGKCADDILSALHILEDEARIREAQRIPPERYRDTAAGGWLGEYF